MEKTMGSKFFISKKLNRQLVKDLKKRTLIEEKIATLQKELSKQKKKIDTDLNKFYEEVDDKTVISSFEYIEKHGTKKQKETLVEIESRYKNSSLLIEDTLNLIDWYEKMCDFRNNNDLKD